MGAPAGLAALLALGLCAAAVSAAAPPADTQGLLPALKATADVLCGEVTDSTIFKAQDALWPAVKAAVRPVLRSSATAEAATAGAARRRALRAAANATALPALSTLSQASQMLSQYYTTLLRLESLSTQQSLVASLKAMMDMPANDTALNQTEAAINRLRSAAGAVAVDSLATGLQRLQAAGSLLAGARQRAAAALNASSAPLATAGQQYQQMTQALLSQLSSPLLTGLLSNATAQASRGRLLQEQAGGQASAQGQQSQQGQQGRQGLKLLPPERRAALAGRYERLRGTRAALRAALRAEAAARRAQAPGAAGAAGSQRRLRQTEEEAAAAEEAMRPLVELLQAAIQAEPSQPAAEGAAAAAADAEPAPAAEEASWDAVDGSDDGFYPSWWSDEADEADGELFWPEEAAAEGEAAPSYAVLEAGLAPVAHVLLTDMLLLIRDTADAALGVISPPPAWAAPFGYAPGYDAYGSPSSFYGFYGAGGEEGADGPGARRRALRQAAPQPPLPAGGAPAQLPAEAFDESYADEESYYGGYEQQGGRGLRQAGQQPPLPAGTPPGQLPAFAFEESYDDESYGDYSDGADEYSNDYYDWLSDDEDELLGLILTLPVQPPTSTGTGTGAGTGAGAGTATAPGAGSSTGPSAAPAAGQEEAVPPLQVYPVFAGSGRGGLVPALARRGNGSAAAGGPAVKPLERIVTPFAQGAKPHTPDEQKGFDPRYAGIIVSVAFVVLLAGVLIAWRKRRSAAAVVTEQQEALLYSHIPGTPAKKGGAAQPTASPWAAGKGSKGALAAAAAAGSVPKKLSNLPA